jgi:hypothetical protein
MFYYNMESSNITNTNLRTIEYTQPSNINYNITIDIGDHLYLFLISVTFTCVIYFFAVKEIRRPMVPI